ncbi:MAG TPA: energy-coupling factor transporter ATPase [bacterium]|nr:energy-coupling factor transporter ATPase [bacterium]
MASAAPALIRVRGLRHTYQHGTPQAVPALHGIDLDVFPGECVAIVGGNGSGKSTLARHLNALLIPTDGDVVVDGLNTRDADAVWEVRGRVGMIFEQPDDQIVAAVVEEDVAFGCENLGVPSAEIRARVDAALRTVDLEAVRRRPPHLLSGGQKQRVAIAGVLAMRPRCLVLDEATSMLDPHGQREVMETALALCRDEGLTLVLITHAMEEAALADRIVVLAEGRVVLEGTPADVFAREDALRALRLEPPEVTQLGRRLADAGCALPPALLTVEALVDAVAALRGGGAAVRRRPSRVGRRAGRTRPRAAGPMLRCDGVSYVYQRGTPLEAAALVDVSIEIRPGEIVGLIGASGSGKSTLAQHLNGLLRPTRGRVYLDDVDIQAKEVDRRRVHQEIGLLFQYPEHQLFEETVSQDVAFGPRNLGIDEAAIRERVDRALVQVGLDPVVFGPRSPFTLSNGEKRRAALAGLLAMEPRVLILDEPTAGLDPQGRREILDHVVRLRDARGLTIVLISHSMDAVARLCERLIVMDRGRVVADGPIREVFSDPDRLVALGLGLPQVAQCARLLRGRGLPVRRDVLTVGEARGAILDALALERAGG